jgi:hypothetical protein
MTNQNKVVTWAIERLLDHRVAWDYMTFTRGITSTILKKYKVGYIPESLPIGMPSLMEAAGFTVSTNRILLPNLYGKSLVMVSSRSLDMNPYFRHMHLYWDGTYIPYGASQVSFEFDNSPLYVVESPICCMTLAQRGFPAVAVYGQSFSRQMGKFLSTHYTGRDIVLIADADSAGMEGFRRLGLDILSRRPNVYLAYMIGEKDVNAAFLKDRVNFNSLFLADIESTKELLKAPIAPPAKPKVSKAKDTTLQDLKDRASILDVAHMLGMKVPNSNEPKIYTGCPIHKDSNPSLVIYPKTNSFYCFGACNTGGDQLTLIQLAKGCDFKTAVDWLRSTFS